MGLVVYGIVYSDTDLVFDVHDDYIETISWWISYCCILMHMDEILIDSRWDCIVRNQASGMLMKITEKVLLDCNTVYNFTVYRIYGYCYCLLSLLLFTAYTITVYFYIVLLLSLYHSCNLDNMNIDWNK